ncbi:hypothetical protein PILCRDRAFT_15995 [Piloderma croceum F 1598]|uniref:Uncharacterized protein n=1 Tax=Piloderma croceum (strain F 1598) TaxID=765440 RepID=A0A0C3AFP1_PILCF|nr:hypothetical protein PILCRDRAFT_15995 [Piloderma croceum F 1598]
MKRTSLYIQYVCSETSLISPNTGLPSHCSATSTPITLEVFNSRLQLNSSPLPGVPSTSMQLLKAL